MNEFHEIIKKYRKMRKMTQADLAIKMGYADKSMISKIENGLVDIPVSKIMEFASVLKIPLVISSDDKEILETLPGIQRKPSSMTIQQEIIQQALNKLGYNVEKYNNNQYSLLSDKGAVVLSQDEYNEFMNGLKEVIRNEATKAADKYLKDYIMKFLQKAFSTNSSP